jgi:hypothetical protein
MFHHDDQLRIIRLNDYNTLFHFKIESHAGFRPLVSKIICSTVKSMSTMYSLNTLSGQTLVSGSASTFLLKTYLSWISSSFHNSEHIHNHNVFDMKT